MRVNERRRAALIIFIAWFAYVCSYLGRSDYSACILEIVNTTGASRTTAGMVSSVFAICNAFGQIAGGLIIKKISPIKIISVELVTVCAINLLFPLTNSFVVMAVLWGINGIVQATLLSSITQIFASTLKEPYLSRGLVLLNTIGAVGGLFNYVLAYALIRFLNWKAVFFVAAALLMCIGVAWYLCMPRLAGNVHVKATNKESQAQTQQKSFFAVLRSYGTAYVIMGALFIGSLRESVSLWIPSYMNEMFALDSAVSTVITAVVPCMQVCGAFLGGYLGRKFRNLQFLACATFLCSAMCLLMIRLLGSINPVISISFFAMNAVSMTTALTFLVSLFPVRYANFGNVALLVGVINFAVHAGDFAASMGIGWLSEFGWDIAFVVLCVVAFLGGIICLLGGMVCAKQEKA